MGGGGTPPCASCKLLRRRCAKECIFAAHFPSDEPSKFAIVHKVFGASNVSKMLQELPIQQRGDAASSLVYEAAARIRDPVYGCVGAISHLQNQVSQLQMQLAVAQTEILCIQMQQQQEEEPNLLVARDEAAQQIVSSDQIIIGRDHGPSKLISNNFVFRDNVDNNTGGIDMIINYASSSHSNNNNIAEVDPLKREFLWA